MIPFIGIGVVTIYMGWVMVAKKEIVIYPHESLFIQIAMKIRGEQAANNLASLYSKPSRQVWLGIGNLISGAGCLIYGIIEIIAIILRGS